MSEPHSQEKAAYSQGTGNRKHAQRRCEDVGRKGASYRAVTHKADEKTGVCNFSPYLCFTITASCTFCAM